MKFALILRTLLIAAVAVLILQPIRLIEGKIAERRARADHALLMGSVMTFALLATVMIATRKLDWGALSQRMRTA